MQPSAAQKAVARRAKREAEEDDALLTLNTLLQALIGSTLTVELRDDSVVSGKLEAADSHMNITLSAGADGAVDDAGGGASAVAASSTGGASVRIDGATIRCVHLPGGIDAPELMRGRLRSIDQGRKQFRKRVRKQPKPKPAERHEPLVSANVTSGVSWGT